MPAKITRVDAGYSTSTITQSVTYTYGVHTFGYNYTLLDSVNYITDPNSPSATYTYQACNIPPYTGPPLIATCDDVISGRALNRSTTVVLLIVSSCSADHRVVQFTVAKGGLSNARVLGLLSDL